MKRPLVVSYGAGVDSTAMLIEMKNRGIRPDLIVFADTGAERPATYVQVERMKKWCAENDFPTVNVVKYVPPKAPYKTLEGNCLSNQTLPSLAFGGKSCSVKWKVVPQETFINNWMAEHGYGYFEIKRGHRVYRSHVKRIHAVGLDNSPADLKRKKQAHRNVDLDPCRKTYAGGQYSPHCDYWYPLQEWKLDREGCKRVIEAAGQPVPIKSCCFFCPAMKKAEIAEQAATLPELHARAIAMEHNYRAGKHWRGDASSTKGLGRRFAWEEVNAA